MSVMYIYIVETRLILLVAVLNVLHSGCSSAKSAAPDAGPREGPTKSTCPETSTLTYDNFGKAFFESYCTGCHSSALAEGDRHDAPLGFDFDTYAGIMQFAVDIDSIAAAGPNASNAKMPIDDPKPSLDERTKLGEWLACEQQNAP